MTVARETTMSPNPARGDTTPPNKKGINPSTADALPELPRSSSRASVVLVGRIIPKHSSNTSNAPSTQTTPPPDTSNMPVTRHINEKATLPIPRPRRTLPKRQTTKLPTMTDSALTPKQTL